MRPGEAVLGEAVLDVTEAEPARVGGAPPREPSF